MKAGDIVLYTQLNGQVDKVRVVHFYGTWGARIEWEGDIVSVRRNRLSALPTTYELPGQNVDALMNSAAKKPALPIDSAERKKVPLYSGLFAYFPAALAQVANHSFVNNEKHNPGKPLQHSRGNSGDHADCILRHLMDAAEQQPGSTTQIEELRGVAWRALAILQEACELGGTKPAPAATFPEEE